MKKGFPNKIFGFPIGWKDLGVIESNRIKNRKPEDYETILVYGNKITIKNDPLTITHIYCGKRISIGKEGSKLFRFCSGCLIKTSEN